MLTYKSKSKKGVLMVFIAILISISIAEVGIAKNIGAVGFIGGVLLVSSLYWLIKSLSKEGRS